jgi:hypothetical protein
MNAIETTGYIDENGRLILDEKLSVTIPVRARVIILLPEMEDIDEASWQKLASESVSCSFLEDPAEDVYTLADGEPIEPQK